MYIVLGHRPTTGNFFRKNLWLECAHDLSFSRGQTLWRNYIIHYRIVKQETRFFIERVIDYQIHVVHSAIRARVPRIRWGRSLEQSRKGEVCRLHIFFVNYPIYMTQLSYRYSCYKNYKYFTWGTIKTHDVNVKLFPPVPAKWRHQLTPFQSLVAWSRFSWMKFRWKDVQSGKAPRFWLLH